MQQQENIASYVIVYTVGFLPSLWLALCDVCVYLYYCRLLEKYPCRYVRHQRKCFPVQPANVVSVGIYGCMYVYVIHV